MLTRLTTAFHTRRTLVVALLAVGFAALTFAAGQGPAGPSILASADTEGHVEACQFCPGGAGMGGLARRATVVADARAKDPALLLVDAGNALYGGESGLSNGKVIVAAYEALKYNAVNISYRDFRLGKAATLALLNGARINPISANLLDADTGKPLLPAYVVTQAGASKVAIIGVTEPPAALASLPDLQGQLKGIHIAPVADALAATLPKAKAEADRVVLLYYGSALGLRPIAEKFGADLSAIVVGGSRADLLPAGPQRVPLLLPAGHGRDLARLASAPGSRAQSISIPATTPEDKAMRTLVAGYLPTVTSNAAPTTQGAAMAGGAALPALAPGAMTPLHLRFHNSAVELTVVSLELADKFGESAPSPGKRFLIIDTLWRNIQKAVQFNDQVVPVQYVVPKLSDHLYLVADGRRVVARSPAHAAGLLSFDKLALEKPNETLAGKILYEVPVDKTPAELTLRFYDFAHGHIVARLVGADAPASAQPVAPAIKNQVVEAAVYGVTKEKAINGQPAPAGMAYVLVDLRARSLLTEQVNAADYVPLAKAGEKMVIGTVADWKESRKYAQLLLDGEYSYLPLDASELAAEPRFLPDVFTGGMLAFLVPESARSVELRCDFPNAALPDGKTIRPTGLVFALEGKRPPGPSRKVIASARDAIFEMSVVGQSVGGDFHGAQAEAGKRFLVLDVLVRNAGGKQQEFFQPKDQLKYVSEKGEQLDASDATNRGPRPPGGLIYIPVGERRSFQIVYAIRADETRPRLAYLAVSEGASKVLTLTPIPAGEAPVARGTPATTPAPTPAPAPSPAPSPAQTPSAVAPAPPTPGPEMKPNDHPAVGQRPVVAVKGDGPDALRVAAHQDRKPAGIAGVGLTAEQVNSAIDEGAAALWKYLKQTDLKKGDDLSTEREDILVALALVHCNYHKKSPEFDAALRKFIAGTQPWSMGTYRAGLLAMLIEAYGDPAYLPKMRDAARYLFESQGVTGVWGYSSSIPGETFEEAAEKHGVVRVEGATPIGKPAEPWKRLTKKSGAGGDFSNTQYAILGLSSASRAGMKMPPETWSAVVNTLRARQCTDGGWDYSDKGEHGYGSMTAANICATAIARFELGEPQPNDDASLEMGLGWLSRNFTVQKHPITQNDWYYYYMYSLERVGRILDTEFIGEHEWYPLGARELINRQHASKLWSAPEGDEKDPRLASSFALLFLTRATPPLIVNPKHGGDGALIATATPPPNHLYIILDASGSMLDNMDGQMKFDLARDAVWTMVKDLPDDSDVALRVYGHRKRATDRGADEDTELLIPMHRLNKPEFKQKLGLLRSRGKTPLALSLEQSLGDISEGDAKHPVTLVLLTDGGEDTLPRRDPVKAAAAVKARKDIRFHIVGFDINQQDWSEQLQAMARASGGAYWPAARAADLQRSLRAAVLGTPEDYQVVDSAGKVVATGQFNQKLKLHEGEYTFQTTLAGHQFSQKLWVNTDGTTRVEFSGAEALDAMASAPQVPAAPPAAQGVAGSRTPTTTATPPKAFPKFCTHCGAPLKPGAKFCTHCGAKVPDLQ